MVVKFYPVKTCPKDASSWLNNSLKLRCLNDKLGKNLYQCVPNDDRSLLVEFCSQGTVGKYGANLCPYAVHSGHVDALNCSSFLSGCPNESYITNEVYKYPACLEINPEKRCYLANENCPNISVTPEITKSIGYSVATDNFNLTSVSQSTTPMFQSDVDPAHIVAGVVPSVVLVAVLIALILVYFRYWRRNRTSCCNESRMMLESIDLTEPMFDSGQSEEICDFSVWKTRISGQISTLTDDEVNVLYCFLCSDSGPPDFTDTEWLDLLNQIRQDVYHRKKPVTSEEAQQTLNSLKSRHFLWVDQTREHLTSDTQDEIMYHVSKHAININCLFYFSSFITAQRYLRSWAYSRKPGEKFVTGYIDYSDPLLIRRLQMDILTHVNMEGTGIFDEMSQILNIPLNIVKGSETEREEFLEKLKETGESVHNRGRSEDSVQHVKWLWRYGDNARPDIVRSCIGLHPHNDIYIIDNKAYRKPSRYHAYPPDVRCLLYCILLVDDYTLDVNEQPHKSLLSKLRERYFKDLLSIEDIRLSDVPEGVIYIQENKLKFILENTRHDVMYAFVTECLVGDSDLEFFFTTAPRDVILEYCRSWKYKKREGERCLYVPNKPEKMYDLFIDKVQLDIITHCTVSDRGIHYSIRKRLGVPEEVLQWDQEARERYMKNAKRGTQTVHHARGMIVGCAGAGKTTLLRRLMGCTEEELRNVKSTEGLEVHVEIFQINDEENKLKVRPKNNNNGNSAGMNWNPNAKTLSFFDFGGQSAYYACHQIYLTRRAFYIVVVDASKRLDQMVDKAVCDQDGSVFSGWTYGGYFVFWIKSIHNYCRVDNEDQKLVILIVATHWEEKTRQYKDKVDFMRRLQGQLPARSNLSQYIIGENCYCIKFPLHPLHDLEKRIFNIASQKRWQETIPKEWAIFEIELNMKKQRRIINLSEIHTNFPIDGDTVKGNPNVDMIRKQDMLRFYHDSGKVLYFNEEELKEMVVVDVQWFIDAFKNIITDALHFEGIPGAQEDWEEYYQTGNLRDNLLTEIWEYKDTTVLLSQKKSVLHFMQRLGLIAVGKDSHYIPCMNRKELEEETADLMRNTEHKSSVLIYQFDVLPFFFFFRLVVACMQENGWKELSIGKISCLYKNAAFFSFREHFIAISVTEESIQLQVFHSRSDHLTETETTHAIQNTIENLLSAIIGSFHRNLMFVEGVRCQEDKEQLIAMKCREYFLRKEDMQSGDENDRMCPLHPIKDRHVINVPELTKYWKF